MSQPGYQEPDYWNQVERLLESGRESHELFDNPIGDGKVKPGKWRVDESTGKLVPYDET